MALDQWLEDSLAPASAPDNSGEWRLNPLRWQLLKAVLRTPPNPRLHALVRKVEQAFAAAGYDGPAPLTPEHGVDAFDCGDEVLNKGLIKRAERAAAGVDTPLRTWVVTAGKDVVGYYSLRPIVALCDGNPAERIGLVYVALCAVDESRRRPNVAERMVIGLMRSAWTLEGEGRPAGAFALTVSRPVKRLFRTMGVRPLGDAIDARGIFTPAIDLAAVTEMSLSPLGAPCRPPA